MKILQGFNWEKRPQIKILKKISKPANIQVNLNERGQFKVTVVVGVKKKRNI